MHDNDNNIHQDMQYTRKIFSNALTCLLTPIITHIIVPELHCGISY